MAKKYQLAWLSMMLIGCVSTGTSWAQQHGHDSLHAVSPGQLGLVSFPVSCNAAAQAEFNRAMALFHSFWFDPAKQSFGKVLEHDPGCGIANWGIAIMSMGNPFTWPPNPNAMKAAEAALLDAQRVGAGSERERDYIAALAVLFEDWANTDYRSRAVAYERAMKDLEAKHSADDEAKILHALALIATALPSDKTFANQREAAAILEPLFKKYPRHPGVAHYLIHNYDYSSLAERGLPAARDYAKIAPAVPHALHMPSHIFSRVGSWPDMVDSNRASYLAAKAELKEITLGVGTYDALHAMDYLVFAHLQQAQDEAAKAYLDEIAAIRKVNVENFVAAYAFAAIPARFALERGDWQQAAALELKPADLAWSKFPQAEAILVFSRGLGAARAGDVAAARRDVERLQALKAAMTEAKLGYWAGQADFQITTVNAWIALAEQRADEALQLMQAAAAAEDASDKHPVTPGNVAPSRELLAEMLLQLDMPAQALAEFERSLQRDPRRFRSVYGAAQAAVAIGKRLVAHDYYTRLWNQAIKHDTVRSELARAKTFLQAS